MDPTLRKLHASQQQIDPELAAELLSGNQGFQPPPSQASFCDAQVQMIHGGSQQGITSGFIHPLLLGMDSQRPTLVNKHQGGWTTFAKQWEQHKLVLQACNRGNPIPDMLLLQYLKHALDQADKLFLENSLELNPRLTFNEFWSMLQHEYDKDSQAQLRLAWESVRLPTGPLTLEKWSVFYREYQLRRDRVEERTPQEEYKLLMRSLPLEWQKKVLREEAKLAENKFLVRLTGIGQQTARTLHARLEEATDATIQDIQLIPQGAIVHCSSAHTQQKVLNLNGFTFNNKVVKCTKVEPTLQGNQLAEHIFKLLQQDQRLTTLRQTWQDPVVPKQVDIIDSNSKNFGNRNRYQNRDKQNTVPENFPAKPVTPTAPSQPPRAKPPQSAPPTANSNQYCGFCDTNTHAGKSCPVWEQRVAQNREICGQCQRIGLPSKHYYRDCPQWKEFIQSKGKGKGKGNRPSSPRPQQPQAPAAPGTPPQGVHPTATTPPQPQQPPMGTCGPK